MYKFMCSANHLYQYYLAEPEHRSVSDEKNKVDYFSKFANKKKPI